MLLVTELHSQVCLYHERGCYIYLFTCVWSGGGTVPWYAFRDQRTTCRSLHFPHHVDSGDQNQAVSLGGKGPYPWSHLPSSIFDIFFKEHL